MQQQQRGKPLSILYFKELESLADKPHIKRYRSLLDNNYYTVRVDNIDKKDLAVRLSQLAALQARKAGINGCLQALQIWHQLHVIRAKKPDKKQSKKGSKIFDIFSKKATLPKDSPAKDQSPLPDFLVYKIFVKYPECYKFQLDPIQYDYQARLRIFRKAIQLFLRLQEHYKLPLGPLFNSSTLFIQLTDNDPVVIDIIEQSQQGQSMSFLLEKVSFGNQQFIRSCPKLTQLINDVRSGPSTQQLAQINLLSERRFKALLYYQGTSLGHQVSVVMDLQNVRVRGKQVLPLHFRIEVDSWLQQGDQLRIKGYINPSVRIRKLDVQVESSL